MVKQHRRFPGIVLAVAGLWTACASAAPAPSATAGDGQPWWRHAVIYEIYPRSFQDSDGDGIGDLNGITARLDYLQELGVDAIWLSPVYPSPQVDFGYDISDYEAIDPQYGTLADFDRLVAEAGRRHIRVIMDMVLNHTSDRHAWFTDSASSRDSAQRDWFVWRDGRTGPNGERLPPNNWQSIFGHSAWQYDPRTGQYYYHRFYAAQPDLNWRNPQVEQAMFDAMRFWLDRGVAGFRLDAVPELYEDPQLRDEALKPGTNAFGDPNQDNARTSNLPEVHALMRRLRAMVDAYPDHRVLIGETYLKDVRALDRWYGGARHDELHLPMDMQIGFQKTLDAARLRAQIEGVETKIHGSEPLLVLDNHDNPRSIDRYGDGVHDQAIARLLATLLLATRDTALLYYGQELGMPTTAPTRVEDVRDPIGVSGWPREKGRDGERTPMQWDAASPQAGFSSAEQTWLPVSASYRRVNVTTERADPDSLWNWYRNLIALRKTDRSVSDGRMQMLDRRNPHVLSFARIDGSGRSVVVALNLSATPRTVSLPAGCGSGQRCSLRTLLAHEGSAEGSRTVRVTLGPYGSFIGAVERAEAAVPAIAP